MKNILLTFRRIKKDKTAMLLGLSGLVVGLVCVFFIFFWTVDEIRYDRYNENIDRIFVVHAYLDGGNQKVNFNGCPPAVGPALENEYPEVEKTSRYIPPYIDFMLEHGDQKYMEKIAFSGFSLFDIMTFPFVYGGRGDENVKNKIVLTETTARKYFGSSNPVGEVVEFDNREHMTVVGVIKDIPNNSSISFSALVPIENMGFFFQREDYLTSWYNNAFITFGLLRSQDDFGKVAASVTNRIQQEFPESTNYLRAYKWEDKYLYEDNNIRNVRIFILIAFLVLMAATLNFINLNTARSVKQIKETGLRKTLGASRRSLIRLIYSDIAVICLLTFLLAILLALAGLPLFNSFVGKQIDPTAIFTRGPLQVLLLVYALTVFIAGSYPSFFLTGFSPIETVRSGFKSVKSKGLFRNALVTVIFVISLMLLSSTLIISRQTEFLQKMDLGYDKNQLMYVYLDGDLKKHHEAFKEELTRNAGIESASVISHLPVMIGNNSESWNWEGKDPSFKPLVTFWNTDADMLNTFGTEMAEGSYFRDDNSQGVIINETFANLIGWDNFEGKSLEGYGSTHRIKGVIRDFHFNSIAEETEPLAIGTINESRSVRYLVLRTNSGNLQSTLSDIKNVAKQFEPEIPLSYGFFEEEMKAMLASERNLRKLVGVFSGFSIIVLVLGLLGVIMFMAEQKTKEIGIRKCMGEPVTSIVLRLIKPFLYSGIAAFLVAVPLSWWIMKGWLESFAFRVDLEIWIFLFAGLLVMFLAVFTVIVQSWRAANRNPVEALRDE